MTGKLLLLIGGLLSVLDMEAVESMLSETRTSFLNCKSLKRRPDIPLFKETIHYSSKKVMVLKEAVVCCVFRKPQPEVIDLFSFIHLIYDVK